MPNKTIYLNTINEIEQNIGFSFINRDEVAQKLQDAWKNDQSEGKVDTYLGVYREIFRDILAKWSDKMYSDAFNSRSEKMPDLKKCLLKTDEALKTCAMALIPELRENEDVLSHMAFGVMEPTGLRNEFFKMGRKYLAVSESAKAMKERKTAVYDKYRKEWQGTTTRKIVEVVRDEQTLESMSKDDKINFAWALDIYRNDKNVNPPLGMQEKELIDDALLGWRKELGIDDNIPFDEVIVDQHFKYAQKFDNNVWMEKEVDDAITEYNEIPNHAKQDIEHYKEVEEVTKDLERLNDQIDAFEQVETAPEEDYFPQRHIANELERRKKRAQEEAEEKARIEKQIKREKETTIRNEGVADEAAEMVGELFEQAEEERIRNIPLEEAERKRRREQGKDAEYTDEVAEGMREFFEQEPIWQKEALDKKRERERTVKNEGVTDDSAVMVGDFFMQEELSQDVKEISEPNTTRKEREFLGEKVTSFNKQYSLRVNKDKLRTSVEQLSSLMVKAREEKELFLAKDSVVVIENGVEKCYTAKDFYKADIEKARKECEDKLKKLAEEREKTKQDQEKFNQTLTIQKNNAQTQKGKEEIELLKADGEKAFKEKNAKIDAEIAEANNKLEDALSAFQGGIVIEKNGNDVRRYKSSQYYETHETKKEQYAYGEYQTMYSRVYKDACKNAKEQNYANGKVTDFAKIANDVDKLFKSAMYISNVYDKEKNVELVQKCSFGGFSAEKLASFVTEIENDAWSIDQTSDQAWAKQVTQANDIIAKWNKEKHENPKISLTEQAKKILVENLAKFEKGAVTKKEMLSYMLAAESHMNHNYSTRRQRFFNFRKYGNEKKALNACRTALGLTENDSLRAAMNGEYKKMAEQMSKEQVFKSIGAKMNNVPSFKDEKNSIEKEHKIVQDRILAEKKAMLDKLRTEGREPITIPNLDERKAILNDKPRVPPINPEKQLQQNLALNQ